MINQDKFGNTIYSLKFQTLQGYGNILLSQGYSESLKKPNLFYKKLPEGLFFADMRGTEEIPIWEDTSPLFYWKFEEQTPFWKRRRLLEQECNNLIASGCHSRVSFDNDFSEEMPSESSSFIAWSEGIFDWENGFCKSCQKDMQKEGLFCSDECEDKYNELFKVTCNICKQRFKENKLIEHHTNYTEKEEKTILICKSCHSKIHFHQEKYTELKEYTPIGNRKDMLERKKKK